MKDRNKILIEILLVSQQYDLDIVRIEFSAGSLLNDKVVITYKINNRKYGVSISYEKDNILEVNEIMYLFTKAVEVALKGDK